jgi:bifunctional polynucleotide phosphatase/kinase
MKEVVIMVGYPGSGKSTYAKKLEEESAGIYYRVDGDQHKTPIAMVRDARTNAGNRSVIFDSTGGTRSRRAAFIQYAQGRGIPVRIVWITTPLEVSMERNKQRHVPVPAIAFYTFRSRFEEPTSEEGILETL